MRAHSTATSKIALVKELTGLVAAAAKNPELKMRTWVLPTEAAPGGWGLWAHTHTNEDLVVAARSELARLVKAAVEGSSE